MRSSDPSVRANQGHVAVSDMRCRSDDDMFDGRNARLGITNGPLGMTAMRAPGPWRFIAAAAPSSTISAAMTKQRARSSRRIPDTTR